MQDQTREGGGATAEPRGHEGNLVLDQIRRIVQAMDRRSKRVARETGLTLPQIVVLTLVRDVPGAATAELSRRAHLSPATVVTILDKLETRGIVARRRSRRDRRVVHTRLTERGEMLLAGAPPLLPKRLGVGLDALSPAERAGVAGAFRLVADLLDPGPGSGPSSRGPR